MGGGKAPPGADVMIQPSIGQICMNYSIDKIQYPVSQLLKCGLLISSLLGVVSMGNTQVY